MKVKAAIALEKAKPLIVDYVDLEGPKQGEVLLKSNLQEYVIQMHTLYLAMIQKVFFHLY